MTTDPSRREIVLAGATAAAATLAGGAAAAARPKEDAMTSAQPELRALLDGRSEGIRRKDLDRLMSAYAPDIVYFDVVPPLQYTGAAALRARYASWFGRWKSAIHQEIRDLNVMAGGDVAVAHMLVRAGGVLQTGREVGYWVRVSNGFRRSNQRWLITHEHVSLPVDLESGKVVMDLVP